MVLTKYRTALLAKKEVTYATDPVPTGSVDAILAGDLTVKPSSEVIDRKDMWTGSLSAKQPIMGRYYGELSFETELKGSGAAGTAPDFGVLIKACGFSETIVAATSVTYAPVSSAFDSVTLYAYRDGLLYKLTGARGNVSLNAQAGQRSMLHFTFKGFFADPSDAAIPSITIDATQPVPCKSSTFVIGGYAATIANVSFDMQNEISVSEDMNAASGYGACSILGRNASGSFDPEATLVATNPWFTAYKNATAQSMSFHVGATAGNIVTVTMPKVVYRDISEGDRNGIYTYNLGFTAAQNAGDDEISIVVT